MVKKKKIIIISFTSFSLLVVWGIYTFDFYYEDYHHDISSEIVTFESDGVRLAGSIFRPRSEHPGNMPGIVLLHGTNPKGSHLFLYQILARELAGKGFIVFLYDQRGYALSDDPPKNDKDLFILDFVGDVIRATKYFLSQPGVDPNSVILIGHSFGGSVAIGVSHAPAINDIFKKIVIISPGRGWPYKGEEKFSFRQRRLSRDMKLSTLIDLTTVKNLFNHFEIERLLEQERSVNMELINGEYEERLKPLADIYRRMPHPKNIHIIKGTGHYFHANSRFNGLDLPVKVYRKDKIRDLVHAITD